MRRPIHGRWPKVAAVAAPASTAALFIVRGRLSAAQSSAGDVLDAEMQGIGVLPTVS